MRQQEILIYLKKEIKTSTVRELAMRLGVKNHTTLFYWLNGGGMSVKNFEQLQKGIEKCKSQESAQAKKKIQLS